jgi:hypothetical protein
MAEYLAVGLVLLGITISAAAGIGAAENGYAGKIISKISTLAL